MVIQNAAGLLQAKFANVQAFTIEKKPRPIIDNFLFSSITQGVERDLGRPCSSEGAKAASLDQCFQKATMHYCCSEMECVALNVPQFIPWITAYILHRL